MAAAVGPLRALCPRALSAVWGGCPLPGVAVVPTSCSLCSVWRSTARTLHLCPSLCAGHNKWSKVKNIKGPKDAERSKMISKFSNLIRAAVREGGSNPAFNVKLANLIEQCGNKSIPKATVETAIKSVEKNKLSSQFMVEASGPGGCLLLIEVLTDNSSRTQQHIKEILSRNGGKLLDGARYNFEKKGVVVVPRNDITAERALELAIEVGAEDVQETEDEEEESILKFICEMAELKKVRTSLEQMSLQVMSAGLEFVPRNVEPLAEDHLNHASNLMEALSDCPEVVQVWDNIKLRVL